MKLRGLGRGLGAILPVDEGLIERSHTVQEIPIEKVEPNPYQPRLDFGEEELEELAASIRQHGLIQPITVRQIGDRYQIIAGERRWRAAQKAGVQHLPAYVRTADNTEMLAFALVENVHRQNLNPIELALAYKRLIEECQLSQEQVAELVGKSRSTIANTLRLLRLPPEIQKALKEGIISEGHARPLLALSSSDAQLQVFKQIRQKGLNVRQVEALVSRYTSSSTPSSPLLSPAEVQLREVEKTLSYHLHAEVRINSNSKGRGEIRITFTSWEDLERLLELLKAKHGAYRSF
ncbi:MAG: ParB/RepB/Spo0J family partition protein [Bacteroidia bacterium]|nr:ParB/RepB/Spo0J family partition protein [Bacteroidia bacterium]MDW8133649.1 ParB/RepB/Spo0J family partition protein [Bacteroidia bacterium]